MKIVARVFVLILFTMGFISSFVVWAEGSEKVKITGITKVWGDTDKKISYIEGDLLITQGEVKIRTKYAEIDQDKKEAKFSQGVHLEKKDLIIDGFAYHMNFKKKQGTFIGMVKLERKESKDAKGKTKDRFKLECERLDIDTEKENFTAFEHAVIMHKEFNGKSNSVQYQNDLQIMTMSGQAELVRQGKENIAGETVQINLDKKTFAVLGSAELTFDVDKEEDDQNKVEKNDDHEGKSEEDKEQKDVTIEMDQAGTKKGS